MISIFSQTDALFRFYYYIKSLILASGIYLTTDPPENLSIKRRNYKMGCFSLVLFIKFIVFLKKSNFLFSHRKQGSNGVFIYR